MKKHWLKRVPFVIGIAALAATVFSSAVMLLWNGVLVAVLHVGSITFLQALGILVLSRLLFGFRGRRPAFGGPWRWKMRARWQNMTPEEREKFMSQMGCGRWQMHNETSAAM